MSSPATIAKARVDARLARLRLTDDIALLRGRASPGNAVADVRERAVEAASDLRDRAIDTARRRPLLIAGAVGGLALLAGIGPLRRAASAIGGALWRNRGPIGQFIETKRSHRKDQRP